MKKNYSSHFKLLSKDFLAARRSLIKWENCFQQRHSKRLSQSFRHSIDNFNWNSNCEMFVDLILRLFHRSVQNLSVCNLRAGKVARFPVSWRRHSLCSILRRKVSWKRNSTKRIFSLKHFPLSRIINELINQSQNGKYGDTSGIGQLIHQMSNLQGSQEQYVDHCNIPLPTKQKYASFDAPVRSFFLLRFENSSSTFSCSNEQLFVLCVFIF